MKKYLPAIVALIAALFVFTGWYYWHHPLTAKALINGHLINLEVSVSEKEKQLGLGYRDSQPINSGMLFIYDHEEQYHYWMKGMRFPLDFMWIKGKVITDITKNVPPPAANTNVQDLSVYFPKHPVDKILEVNAGTVDRLGIKEGDEVKFITN